LRAQLLALHAAQPHRRVVHQRRLVQRQVQAALGAHRQRRVDQAHLGQWRALDGVFQHQLLTRRDGPGRGGLGDIEFGQLVNDAGDGQLRLFGQLVAKAQAVVEHPHAQRHAAALLFGLLQLHQQLAVMVAHAAAFAPGLLPGLVDLGGLLTDELEAAVQLVGVGQQQAQARGIDQRPAGAVHAVGEPAFTGRLQRDDQLAVRRGDAGDGLVGMCGAGAQQRCREGEERTSGQAEHVW
jgi:hypothetical protein